MSTGRRDDRNEDVWAYPLEVSEIERFRRAMEKGGIVPFHCRSPLVFLIDAGHARHAALLKIGLACRGGRQTLEKVRSQRADLRAWRQAGRRLIGGHRRRSGLKSDELLFLSSQMNNVFIVLVELLGHCRSPAGPPQFGQLQLNFAATTETYTWAFVRVT